MERLPWRLFDVESVPPAAAPPTTILVTAELSYQGQKVRSSLVLVGNVPAPKVMVPPETDHETPVMARTASIPGVVVVVACAAPAAQVDVVPLVLAACVAASAVSPSNKW